MEPIELTAAAIATLVLTKAFEATGEKLGENVIEQGGKLLQLLKRKSPNTVYAIEQASEAPLDLGQAVREIEAAAKEDSTIVEVIQEVQGAAKEDQKLAEAIQAVTDAIKTQPSNTDNFTNTVDKIVNLAQGQGASIKIDTQTIQI